MANYLITFDAARLPLSTRSVPLARRSLGEPEAAAGTLVFVDIDPRTYNVDSTCLDRAIGPCTRSLLVVHQMACGTNSQVRDGSW
jgi:hypothetical protein